MNLNHGKKQNRSFGTIIAPYLFVLPAFVIVFVFIVLAGLLMRCLVSLSMMGG